MKRNTPELFNARSSATTLTALTTLTVLTILAVAAPVEAQAPVPKSWNRLEDWVAQKNPHGDSRGNLVWSYDLRRGSKGHPMKWSTPWSGWTGAGAAKFQDGGIINKNGLIHMTRYDIWKCYYCLKPQAKFKNVTRHSFKVAIQGKLALTWHGAGSKTYNTPLTVTFEYYDISQAKGRVLFSKEFGKPTANDKVESISFGVNVPSLRMDPGDHVQWSIVAKKSSGSVSAWMILGDTNLRITRTGLAAEENVRRASPNNPLTLSGGKTSRPIIGRTWDPYIKNPPKGAVTDILAIGTPLAGQKTPFGTLLCNPLLLVTGKPGAPFQLAIPINPSLIGARACVQGASATNTSLLLANALDVMAGDM